MARAYKVYAPFNVAMRLLVPTSKVVKGATVKTYPSPDDAPLIMGSFRTFGGTENFENNIYTIIDTAIIETWYRPDIKADCQLYICQTGETFDIIATPENINMQNQYLQIKVRKVGGKA